MINKYCDTCKNEVNKLNELQKQWQTNTVVEVCDNCLKEIDNLLDSVIEAQRIQRISFIKRFINKIVNGKTSEM